MKIQRSFLLFFIALVLIYCAKKVNKSHPDMVGTWRTSNTTLEIKGNSAAYWGRLTNTEEERINGTARIKKNKLIISGGGLKKQVNINAYPYQEQATFTEYNTVMILNNEKFFKTPKISIDGKWSCSNGVQDQDETGLDCGGTYCDPCPTCNDHVMNEGETGIDCGGNCIACEEAPCVNTFIADGVNILTCPGNTLSALNLQLNVPDMNFTDTTAGYELHDIFGNWEITLVFPKKPSATLKYQLSSDYASVSNSTEYNIASVSLRHNFGSNPATAVPVQGSLYVTVKNGTSTFTFCDVDFSSTQYGCLKASGKFIR